jgi:hypothetical protein
MALSPQLLQFKSSGVYRLEFDKSQTVNIPAETIRLVVGSSKKGPYNTPVFIENIEQFTQVFGGIDKSLEKKGMYFHRSCIETLSRGPILALNLTIADIADKIALVSPATNSSQEGLSATALPVQYSSIFDTDKFWVPSDIKTLQAASNTSESSNNAITFANIKQEPITVIIRQAANTSGFEMTAREWYGEGNVPEGIEDLDYVSDYMVDVFVFKGSFDAELLQNDPTYGDFFTAKGLERSKLASFTALREVSLVAQYSGSVIPEFQDQEGRQLYIETLINLEARRTGLFCAINEEALGSVDFVGNDFDIYQDYKVLSHRVEQDATPTAIPTNKITEVSANEVVLKATTVGDLLTAGISDNGYLRAAVAGEFTKISSIAQDVADVRITTEAHIKPNVYEEFADLTAGEFNSGAAVTVVGGEIHIASPAGNGLNAGVFSAANGVVLGNFLLASNGLDHVSISSINLEHPTASGNVIQIVPASGGAFSSTYAAPSASSITAKARTASTSFEFTTIAPNTRAVILPTQLSGYGFIHESGSPIFKLSSLVANDTFDWKTVKVGMYVPAKDGKLARIKRIIKTVSDDTLSNIYEFQCHRQLVERPAYTLKRYEESTTTYTMFPLAAATQSPKSIPQLLTQLKPGTGLSNTLIDKDAITFRYVVDTFGSLSAGGGIINKEEITQLCKERQNASAILNAPMVKEFKAATNPSFKDSLGVFDTRLVATGGNLELNPTAIYTLPSLNEGANFGFYYSPGLNVLENGRTKVIPPAAYVSNNYIDKYLDALPWSIIAGPRRGVVGGTGVQGLEFAFDKNDRDNLEPFGINPIVFERGVGLTIKGNKTAQQSIQSALSSAHVREAMIYIEDGLAEILKNYLFEFNNAQTRLEIKTLADSFMESVKKDGGVYDYRNIMDGSNNTNDVIDHNMGILDTFVEPVKGLEILVSRVTILNTGEIATGNFA